MRAGHRAGPRIGYLARVRGKCGVGETAQHASAGGQLHARAYRLRRVESAVGGVQSAGAVAGAILPARHPGVFRSRGRFHLATTQKRAPARKSATPKAAKAPARAARSAGKPASKATTAARKTPPRAVVKKAAPMKRVAAARKAAPAKKMAQRSGKAVAQAGPAKSPRNARPKVAKVLDAAARLHQLVRTALEDLKAKDVSEIDVRGKSGVTDLLVIASGTSSRHVKSIADEVVKKAKQAGMPPIGVEGQREAEWVLVDLGDVIVHVMLPRTREFYGLERLWTVGDSEPEMLAG